MPLFSGIIKVGSLIYARALLYAISAHVSVQPQVHLLNTVWEGSNDGRLAHNIRAQA